MDLEENLPCFRSSRPSRIFTAMARSCMSWRIRSRMCSLGVAYTSLSLARSSTYLRSASVNWTLRLLLKVWHSSRMTAFLHVRPLGPRLGVWTCGLVGEQQQAGDHVSSKSQGSSQAAPDPVQGAASP